MASHRRNSVGNSEILGSLAVRISETSIYGKEKISGTDSEIDKIKKALNDYAKQVKMGRTGKRSNIKTERKEEIGEN